MFTRTVIGTLFSLWLLGAQAAVTDTNKFFPGYLSLNGLTNRVGDSGSALTYNGNAVGGGTTRATPALGASGTNIVVDYSFTDLELNTSTNMNLSSFSNTAAANTAPGTTLKILASGGNVIVNNGLGSTMKGAAAVGFPVTITAGNWGVFSFKSYGSSVTNNGVVFTQLQ
jgi:hypothetical protein